MRVGLLGDMHGREFWLNRAIDTVIQVGDLGVWPGNQAAATWDRINKRLVHQGTTILCAPGNHEDWDQVLAIRARDVGCPNDFLEHLKRVISRLGSTPCVQEGPGVPRHRAASVGTTGFVPAAP